MTKFAGITALPEEILLVIFEYNAQSFVELVQYSHVNRVWRLAVCKSRLWTTLDDSIFIPRKFTHFSPPPRAVAGQRPESTYQVCLLRSLLRSSLSEQGDNPHPVSHDEETEQPVSLTPSLISYAYILLRTSMQQELQRRRQLIATMDDYDGYVQNPYSLFFLAVVTPMSSFAGFIAMTCCIQAAGPTHLYSTNDSFYYWKTAFGLFYIVALFHLVCLVGHCIHRCFHRVMRYFGVFHIPWDEIWIPLATINEIVGLLSLMINFHRFLAKDVVTNDASMWSNCIAPILPMIVFTLLGTFVSLCHKSKLDNSHRKDLLLTNIYMLNKTSVYTIFTQQTILPQVIARSIAHYRLQIHSTNTTNHNNIMINTIHHTAFTCNKNNSGNDYNRTGHNNNNNDRETTPSKPTICGILDRQQLLYALLYLFCNVCIIVPVGVAFYVYSVPDGSVKNQNTLIGTSIPLFFLFCAYAIMMIVQAIKFIIYFSNEEQENSKIPLSWMIAANILIGMSGLLLLFFCVWIALMVFQVVPESAFVTIPTAISASLTCAHLSIFVIPGILW